MEFPLPGGASAISTATVGPACPAKKFVAWTGYQITNAPQLAPAQPAPMHRIERDIDRAIDAVATRLREIESLKSMLLERRDRPAD